MPNKRISKNKLSLIVGGIASLIFLVGVPLRQAQMPLNFLSGLHGTTSVSIGINLRGTFIGALLVFITYYIVGWIAVFIYGRL